MLGSTWQLTIVLYTCSQEPQVAGAVPRFWMFCFGLNDQLPVHLVPKLAQHCRSFLPSCQNRYLFWDDARYHPKLCQFWDKMHRQLVTSCTLQPGQQGQC